MKDLISVIVPVYNVAAYLPECLDSILNQDHRRIEVILTDDGSTDASGAICDDYARKDSRVKVIHQKNGGAASAKNAALRMARGEYLSFVDSDDLLEPGAYRYMLQVLKETNADAGEFSYRDLYPNRREDQILFSQRLILEGKDYLVRFTEGWSSALLWNKLYKRSLFAGIFFEEGHKIDDEYFTYQGFLNAKRVVCDNRIVYNYRRRASSVMLNPAAHTQRAMDRIDAYDKRRQMVAARFPELRKVFDTQYLDALTYLTAYPDNTPEIQREYKNRLRAYMRQRGNSIAPKCLWRGLLELYLTPTEKLLARYGRKAEQRDADAYFL